mgnify:CR=1 FL=1
MPTHRILIVLVAIMIGVPVSGYAYFPVHSALTSEPLQNGDTKPGPDSPNDGGGKGGSKLLEFVAVDSPKPGPNDGGGKGGGK